MKTYTLAIRYESDKPFNIVEGIPQNMTLAQAEALAKQSRANGFDVVPFNVESV